MTYQTTGGYQSKTRKYENKTKPDINDIVNSACEPVVTILVSD